MQADRINLLPKKMKKNPHDGQTWLVTAGSIVFFLLAAMTGFNSWQSKSRENQFLELSSVAKDLADKAAQATQKVDAADELNQRLAQTNDFLAKKTTWTGALKELSLLIPKTVWLSNFAIRKVKGQSPYIEISGSAGSQRKIASFLESLEMSYYFHAVNLRKSEKVANTAPELYKFELEVQIPQSMGRGLNDKAK